MATVLLAIPTLALGGLAWYGTGDPGGAASACRAWSVEFRHARDDLATAERLWRQARSGQFRPPEREDFRARTARLAAARPPRCDNNGFRS